MSIPKDIPTLFMECNAIQEKALAKVTSVQAEYDKVQQAMDKILSDPGSRIAIRSNPEIEKSFCALREKIHLLLNEMQTCLKVYSLAQDLSCEMLKKQSALDTFINPHKDPRVEWSQQLALFGRQVEALKQVGF